MDFNRANERPLEAHGAANGSPGSVKDWHSDQLATSFSQLTKMREIVLGALATQSLTNPPPQDTLTKTTATFAALESISILDKKAGADIESAATIFVKEWEGVNQPALNSSPDEYAKTAFTEATYKSNQALGAESYYGISVADCKNEVNLGRMCDRAHAMVQAGYVGEKELENLKVALTDTESVKSRAAEAFYSMAASTGISLESKKAIESDSSYFQRLVPDFETLINNGHSIDDIIKGVDSPGRIVVSVDEDRTTKNRAEPTLDTFTHELGHWLSVKTMDNSLEQGVARMEASGGRGDIRSLINPAELSLHDKHSLEGLSRNAGGILGQSMGSFDEALAGRPTWMVLAKEMQGDLLSIAGENAEFGREAALAMASQVVIFRDDELLGRVESASMKDIAKGGYADGRMTEDHHTSLAIIDFASRIGEGALDEVHTPAALNKLIGESVVVGLVGEYEKARTAEINPFHLVDGKAVPGLPEGVRLQDFLVADMKQHIEGPIGAPTFIALVSEAPLNTEKSTQILVASENGEKQFLVASKALPDGIIIESGAENVQTIDGRFISAARAPFAQDVMSIQEAFLTGPGRTVDNSEINMDRAAIAPDRAGASAPVSAAKDGEQAAQADSKGAQQQQNQVEQKSAASSAPSGAEMSF